MPKIVKPLSDAEIRRAKPKDKDYKLPDGMGLSVLVDTKGNKYWRFNYPKPYTKKRSTLGWGSYNINEKLDLMRLILSKFGYTERYAQYELIGESMVTQRNITIDQRLQHSFYDKQKVT